ncbi:MAG: zinc dependent phospholipase C family protein [Eggerthellaceae bacterium]
MPAFITHYSFGKRLLERLGSEINDRRQIDAFLIGNQGPDPLFYSFLSPFICRNIHLGSKLHESDPACFFQAWVDYISECSDSEERKVYAGFLAGMFCHYLLDVNAHPLIDYFQDRICEIEESDFSENDKSVAHMVVEREIDEMMLYVSTGKTVFDFDPAAAMLALDDDSLDKISAAFSAVVFESMGERMAAECYARSMKNFRWLQGTIKHPRGFKFALAGGVEKLLMPRSRLRAMKLRPVAMERTRYANEGHGAWVNPQTGETSTQSLSDLFDVALDQAVEWIPRLLAANVTVQDIEELTCGRDYSGRIVSAKNPDL